MYVCRGNRMYLLYFWKSCYDYHILLVIITQWCFRCGPAWRLEAVGGPPTSPPRTQHHPGRPTTASVVGTSQRPHHSIGSLCGAAILDLGPLNSDSRTKCGLPSGHAYILTGSDEERVAVLNPWGEKIQWFGPTSTLNGEFWMTCTVHDSVPPGVLSI